ncbi:MAG: NADH-quinone oxidoreductase subunit C [Candidatus Omnitrophica bacterium]|nr:NADH-quinone oxidoreductase subunit C [Candidatus Omnitrophota bacterium]
MDTVKRLQERFDGKIRNISLHSDKRIYVDIDKDDLIEFVKFVFIDLDARFITASGVDVINNFEILYHFSIDRADVVVSLRTYLDRENPEIESIVPVVKGASNIEREMYELLGIRFKNHPDLKRFLTDDSLDVVHPLRKDAKRQVKQ